jgi:hypothetical protein
VPGEGYFRATVVRTWDTERVISDEELLAEIERGILTDEPVTKTLRALLLLGGRLDSKKLATWAKRELNGYDGVDEKDVPVARTVGAPIFINAMVGYTQITGQIVSAAALPKPFSDVLDDDILMRGSIGEIEALIAGAKKGGDAHISLTLPNWEAIARVIDKDHFGQHTTQIYRQVATAYLDAIVADVRNHAAELMGEFRRTAKGKNHDLPRGRQADEIVSGVVVTGDNNSIVVASGKQQKKISAKTSTTENGQPEKRGWWDAWGKAATIIGAIAAALTIAIIVFYTVTTGVIPAP